MTGMTRKRRRMVTESTMEIQNTILPEELMIEILSRVDESNPLQLRCVCKWWKSLVVDPQFVKKHLHRSFTDITDLASKAMDDMNAFVFELDYAPAAPHDEEEEDDDDEEDDDEEEEDDEDEEEEDDEDNEEDDEDDDEEEEEQEEEEEEEEEEEKYSMVNLVARLDNLLHLVRSMKGSLETIKFDVQAINNRMKCLQNFLQVYLKSATASSSLSSSK